MDRQVTITLERLTKVIYEVVSGERLAPLMKEAPVMALAFTVFGAELTRILFNIGEGKNE